MPFASAIITRLFQKLTLKPVPLVLMNGEPKKVVSRPDGVHRIFLQDTGVFWIEVNDVNNLEGERRR